MKTRIFLTAVSLIIALGFLTGTAEAQQPPGPPPGGGGGGIVEVDCTDGDSIQDAVDDANGPTTIMVEGECNETITIVKDDIEIAGEGLASTSIVGPGDGDVILVDGARRVVIRDLAVTGGSTGIKVRRGAAVTLEDVRVHGNSSIGVFVDDAGWAHLKNSIVEDNDGEAGLLVLRGAQARATDTDFFDNGPRSTPGEGFGVEVQQGSYWQFGGTNSGSLIGIGVFDSGRAEVREATTSGIDEAAVAQRHSYIRFRKGEVIGTIQLRSDSTIILQRLDPAFGGTASCADGESSVGVFGPPAAAFPTGGCTGF